MIKKTLKTGPTKLIKWGEREGGKDDSRKTGKNREDCEPLGTT